MRRPRLLLGALLCAFAAHLSLPLRAAEPFTVVAYNVANWLVTDRFVDNRPVDAAPKPDDEKDAVVSIIASHKPAIVGVTEMGSRDDLEDLRRRLKAKGLDYPHVEWHEGLDPHRHVALLSQFPIVARNSKKIAFDLNGQPQGVQRGVLDVTVEPAPGYQLRLIGLHLKSRRPVPEFDEKTLRAKEAWFVRQHIDGIFKADPKTRLLVFGDLNDTKNEYPLRELMGARSSPRRLVDIPVEDSLGQRWTHYWRTADEYARIDFFLASPTLLPEIDRAKSGINDAPDWLKASDHRAIFLTITPPAS